MKWWQEAIFWVLAFIAYVALMNWLPEGRALDKVFPLLILVGAIAWLIWKGRRRE